jgi:hypothetical protein
MIDEILGRAQDAGLPRPTYVICSGRGLYAKWIFKEAIGPSNLPVWDALQSVLVAVFRALHADACAKDAARVLRTLGSMNSRVGDDALPVRIEWQNTELVDFEVLCKAAQAVQITPQVQDGAQALMGSSQGWSDKDKRARIAQVRQKQRQLSELTPTITRLDLLDHYAKMREPILLQADAKGAQAAKALNWRRFLDIKRLAHLRGGVHEGERDTFLFWMATCLANAGVIHAGNFWQELRSLAPFIQAADYKPLQDGSMSSLYARVLCHGTQRKNFLQAGGDLKELSTNPSHRKDALYSPSNAMLIERFNISKQEQQHMLTLIDPDEKLRRSDEKNPGRTEHRQQLAQMRGLVLSLADEGLTAPQAARQAGCSRQQAYRWIQARELSVRHPSKVKASLTGAAAGHAAATTVAAECTPRARAVSRQQITQVLVHAIEQRKRLKQSKRTICLELGISESVYARAVAYLLPTPAQMRKKQSKARKLTPEQAEQVAALRQELTSLNEAYLTCLRQAQDLKRQVLKEQGDLEFLQRIQALKRKLPKVFERLRMTPAASAVSSLTDRAALGAQTSLGEASLGEASYGEASYGEASSGPSNHIPTAAEQAKAEKLKELKLELAQSEQACDRLSGLLERKDQAIARLTSCAQANALRKCAQPAAAPPAAHQPSLEFAALALAQQRGLDLPWQEHSQGAAHSAQPERTAQGMDEIYRHNARLLLNAPHNKAQTTPRSEIDLSCGVRIGCWRQTDDPQLSQNQAQEAPRPRTSRLGASFDEPRQQRPITAAGAARQRDVFERAQLHRDWWSGIKPAGQAQRAEEGARCEAAATAAAGGPKRGPERGATPGTRPESSWDPRRGRPHKDIFAGIFDREYRTIDATQTVFDIT